MQDRLPLRDVAADESASARIPEISRKWSAAQPFFAAADKRDIAAFRAAASSLAEAMAPTAATAANAKIKAEIRQALMFRFPPFVRKP